MVQGADVEVWFNPKTPNESALETAKTAGGIKAIIVFSLLIIVVVSFIIGGLFLTRIF